MANSAWASSLPNSLCSSPVHTAATKLPGVQSPLQWELWEMCRTCHRAWSALFSCVQTICPQVYANIVVFSYVFPTSRGRFGCFTNHTISSLLLLTLLMFSLPHTHAHIQVSATCSYGFSLVWIKASSTSFNRFAQMEGLRGEIMLVRRGFSALSM